MHEQRVQAVDQLVDSRFDWAHAFHELGRVLPPGTSRSPRSRHDRVDGGSTSAGADRRGREQQSRRRDRRNDAGRRQLERGDGVELERGLRDPAGSVPTFTLGGCATSQTEVALTLTACA